MNLATAKALIGMTSLAEAQLLERYLKREGIQIVLVHNAASCNSGCGTQVEMWAHSDDLPIIQEYLVRKRQETFEAHGYDACLSEEVFDTTLEHAKCPACGTEFATALGQCPECELYFDLPEKVQGRHSNR